jgi:multiple sugar transport system ATP-binding protein
MPDNLFVAEFIGAPKMNVLSTTLTMKDGKYYVNPYGVEIEVDGAKGEALAQKGIEAGDVILGVRPEHIVLTTADDKQGIECTIEVNEMMGSEVHLHVVTETGDKLIVRVPTISLDDEQRHHLGFGDKIHITFEGKVMHFFAPETELNLLGTGNAPVKNHEETPAVDTDPVQEEKPKKSLKDLFKKKEK